jgi:hypothetical protein
MKGLSSYRKNSLQAHKLVIVNVAGTFEERLPREAGRLACSIQRVAGPKLPVPILVGVALAQTFVLVRFFYLPRGVVGTSDQSTNPPKPA